MNGWGTEDPQGSDHDLYDSIMADTSHGTLVQTHRMYNTESEP